VPSEERAAASPHALTEIAVEGDPRAMGSAQGRACRDAIRAAVSAASVARRGRLPTSLLPFAAGPVLGKGMGREIVRHYPHLSERIQGIARGAGLSVESTMELFVRAAQGRIDTALGDPAPGAVRAGSAALLCRPLARADWILRRSRPEVGFASVELTLPWLATAIAGVNEKGVAAAVAPVAAGGGAKAPSVLLLVQECLQRFHDLPGCIDWCRKRPFSGRACILLADASGAAALVNLEDGRRQIRETRDEVLAGGGCEDRHPEFCKSLAADAPVEQLAPEIGARVVVSPGQRAMWVWADASGPAQRFSAP
jgi:hypothetical protein